MGYQFSNRIMTLKPSPIRESMKFAVKPGVISFAQGNPSPEAFPMDAIRSIINYLLDSDPAPLLQYGTTEGYAPLRQTLKDRMKNHFQCGREFDELVIVSGAQQAVELAAKSFCNEGDTVLCENPSFIGSINAFRSYNLNLRGIAMEDDGIDISSLERAFQEEKNVKLLYLIPNFQNPLGTVMSLEKRKTVYELAKKYHCMILEDNPYGEIRFQGHEVPNIKSFDEDGLVLYCGSFSKILAAGIRVGFVLAPIPVVQKMVVAKQVSDVHTNLMWQAVADHFLTDYDFEAHLKRLCGIYGRKCRLMVSSLKESAGGLLRFNEPEGGFFLWCRASDQVDMQRFYRGLKENNINIFPGKMLMVTPNGELNSFRLNFSTPSDDDIRLGCEKLGETLKKSLN